MRLDSKALLAAAGLAAFAFSPANAYEGGYAGWQTKPGVFIGSSAGVPPPGIYMFNQIFTYQANLTGPGTSGIGNHVGVQAAVDVQGFLFVPGWTFLGATYDAVIAQPFVMDSIGSPLAALPGFNNQAAGVHNSYLVPVELSWKFGTSGFNVKTGLGIGTPDGTITGPTGLGNQGNPWWTFQPELILSYLKDGWNLSVAMYDEINTANTIDNYTTGNIFTPTSRLPRPSESGRLVRSLTSPGRLRTTNARSASAPPSSRRVPSATPKGTICGRLVASSNITLDRRASRCGQPRRFMQTPRTLLLWQSTLL
jgi:hypothetical protein